MSSEDAKVAKRVVYQREDCKWAWRLVAANGKVIAVDGSQGYENEVDARSMADRIVNGEFSEAKRLRAPKEDCKS